MPQLHGTRTERGKKWSPRDFAPSWHASWHPQKVVWRKLGAWHGRGLLGHTNGECRGTGIGCTERGSCADRGGISDHFLWRMQHHRPLAQQVHITIASRQTGAVSSRAEIPTSLDAAHLQSGYEDAAAAVGTASRPWCSGPDQMPPSEQRSPGGLPAVFPDLNFACSVDAPATPLNRLDSRPREGTVSLC